MKITQPENCPVCNSKLILVKDQLFCRNKECPAQTAKKLEHFCKTVKMKGFGPVALSKLDFESILDIYTFSESTYKNLLGDTIGAKLFKEVRLSEKNTDLEQVIAGLSIPLVGNTAASKLCEFIDSVDDINEETCSMAGLGEKVTNNLLEYVNSEEFSRLQKLLRKFKVGSNKKVETPSLGITVCITGKLDDYKNRSEAAKYLSSLGFTVVDSVTKATNILINEEDRESSKLTKAISLGIRVTTIKDLEKEINK
jgi:NAD-dependent DNA ligase